MKRDWQKSAWFKKVGVFVGADEPPGSKGTRYPAMPPPVKWPPHPAAEYGKGHRAGLLRGGAFGAVRAGQWHAAGDRDGGGGPANHLAGATGEGNWLTELMARRQPRRGLAGDEPWRERRKESGSVGGGGEGGGVRERQRRRRLPLGVGAAVGDAVTRPHARGASSFKASVGRREGMGSAPGDGDGG